MSQKPEVLIWALSELEIIQWPEESYSLSLDLNFLFIRWEWEAKYLQSALRLNPKYFADCSRLYCIFSWNKSVFNRNVLAFKSIYFNRDNKFTNVNNNPTWGLHLNPWDSLLANSWVLIFLLSQSLSVSLFCLAVLSLNMKRLGSVGMRFTQLIFFIWLIWS